MQGTNAWRRADADPAHGVLLPLRACPVLQPHSKHLTCSLPSKHLPLMRVLGGRYEEIGFMLGMLLWLGGPLASFYSFTLFLLFGTW
jgi:hypothetical protein